MFTYEHIALNIKTRNKMLKLEKKSTVSQDDVDKLLTVFNRLNPRDIWSRVQPDDFTVKRFSMGVINDIACCELTEKARTRLCKLPNDLPAIVVKFIPKDFYFKLNKTDWIACIVLLSEHQITPKLTYIDDHCVIHEYVEGSRTYKQEDDLEPETVKQLARLVARMHSLEAPISMEGYKLMENWIDDKIDPEDPPSVMLNVLDKKYIQILENERPEFKEKFYETYAKVDVLEIMNYTKRLAKWAQSPIVYSHNDFNRGNRLVKTTKGPDGSTVDKRVYIIDFDMATLNHRGFDLGRYFTNYRHLDDMFGFEEFPEDEEMFLFLEEYRQECGRIQGEHYLEQEVNSIEHLIKEVKALAMSAYGDYLFGLMTYTNDPKGPEADYWLQASYNRIHLYWKQKERFIKEGIIPSDSDLTNGSV